MSAGTSSLITADVAVSAQAERVDSIVAGRADLIGILELFCTHPVEPDVVIKLARVRS